MSRIAGVIGSQGEQAGSLSYELLGALNYMHGQGTWKNTIALLESAAIGTASRNCHTASRQDNVMCVIDGLFYNRELLPKFDNLADIFIELFKRFGFEKSLGMINGDFAIALYDSQSQVGFLARDRAGLRPLYYAQHGNRFAFASRPLALTAISELNIKPDVTFTGLFAGSHYRTIDNNRHRSPFYEISQLPAAHFLEYKNGHCSTREYWSLKETKSLSLTDNELAENYKALLIDAVGRRIKQVENPAFTLSGGLDSSSVLSCAVEYTGKKQIAFSSTYDDPTFDESEDIKSIIDDKVSSWKAVNIHTPNTMKLIREMVALHDEPVATATWLSHYILANQVRDAGHDALFGGLGGDELNGGEYEYFFYLFADLKFEGRNDVLDKEISEWVKYHDHPIFKKNFEVARASWTKLADMKKRGQCLPDRQRIDKYAHTINSNFFDVSEFRPVMDHIFDNYLKNRTHHDIFRETAPCCIRAEDRQTVPFGINNVLPFFDHRLVEFMFQVDNHHKIRDGITKRLLREAMKGILPEETRRRIKKTGWNAPAHIWFSGAGLEELRDIVLSQKFRNRGIYNIPEVIKLFDEHEKIVSEKKDKENHMMYFWQLANILSWLDYIDDVKVKFKGNAIHGKQKEDVNLSYV